MTNEDMKSLVGRFYREVVSGGDLERAEEFIGSDYVDHNAEEAGRGPQVFAAHMQAIRHTFPDLTLEIQDILAEGDKVVTRVFGQGTHRGEWMGIVPTGAVVRLKGINIDRISGGRIVEHWGEADTVGMLVQMGVDPFVGRRPDR
jgi:predicted ester cyclase